MRQFLLLLLCLLLYTPAAAQTLTPAPPHPARVVLIALDGARPDALQQGYAPRMQALAAEGAVDWGAQTILPSATLPAHAAMLTGLANDGWEVLAHNSTAPGCPPIEPPTLLTRTHDAGLRVAMVVGKEKFCHLWQLGGVEAPEYALDTPDAAYFFARAGDASVIDRALMWVADYDVLFVHLPNPDYFGHLHGWMSEVYLGQLSATDAQVGRLLDALPADTLVILTADHGGHGTTHGSALPADTTIPLMVWGAGVLPGTVLSGARVTDAAVTVLWALGLPLPPFVGESDGVPLYAAFAA